MQYPLIGDPTLTLSRNFEVLIEEEGLAYRGTFVIDPDGHIKIIEVHDNGIGRDAKELLRKVQAAQYVASHPGEVCPAKWTPGASTLVAVARSGRQDLGSPENSGRGPLRRSRVRVTGVEQREGAAMLDDKLKTQLKGYLERLRAAGRDRGHRR